MAEKALAKSYDMLRQIDTSGKPLGETLNQTSDGTRYLESFMKTPSSPSIPLISGVVIALVGVALGIAGAWLVGLGGSWYHLGAALALLAVGGLLMRRSAMATWVMATLLVGTLAWALWEVGLDWWPLAARLGFLFLLGVYVGGPWTVHSLRVAGATGHDGAGKQRRASWKQGGGLALSAALAVSAAAMLASWTRDMHAIEGVLPVGQSQPSGTSILPAGEWHAYGRTGYGQRFSPLTQITPANVSKLKMAWQVRTGDMRGQPGDPEETTYEVTPLKVGDRLYLCNPHQSVIAGCDHGSGSLALRPRDQGRSGAAASHLPRAFIPASKHIRRQRSGRADRFAFRATAPRRDRARRRVGSLRPWEALHAHSRRSPDCLEPRQRRRVQCVRRRQGPDQPLGTYAQSAARLVLLHLPGRGHTEVGDRRRDGP